MRSWPSQIIGEWHLDYLYDEMVYKWASYFLECEQYDLLVCSGRNKKGMAIPLTSGERYSSNRHARTVYDRIFSRMPRFGNRQFYDRFQEAKIYASGLSVKELEGIVYDL